MAKYDLNDDGVVVVVGSGAGGGTLANELCQKGIQVVLLEAGKRETNESFVNDEWSSFGQISWLDSRSSSGTWRVGKDFNGLPASLISKFYQKNHFSNLNYSNSLIARNSL